jgi:hypothetical protein
MKKTFVLIIALLCAVCGVTGQTAKKKPEAKQVAAEPQKPQRPKMPIEYFAEYDLSAAQTFGESYANDEGKLFRWSEVSLQGKRLRICPDGYHIPSPEEWRGVVPSTIYRPEGGLWQKPVLFDKEFGNPDIRNGQPPALYNIPETVQICKDSTPKTYLSDYYCALHSFYFKSVAYGLRFKKDNKSTFDNSQLAAFRYQLKGVFLKQGRSGIDMSDYRLDGNTFRLQVTVRYLGESFTGQLETVASEEFWNNNNADDVIRTFSASGRITTYGNLDSNSFNTTGYYWSSNPDMNNGFIFGRGGAGVGSGRIEPQGIGFSVRCVSDN